MGGTDVAEKAGRRVDVSAPARGNCDRAQR
jgi:hypothetical protein